MPLGHGSSIWVAENYIISVLFHMTIRIALFDLYLQKIWHTFDSFGRPNNEPNPFVPFGDVGNLQKIASISLSHQRVLSTRPEEPCDAHAEAVSGSPVKAFYVSMRFVIALSESCVLCKSSWGMKGTVL